MIAKGFVPIPGIRSFAIMEKPWKRGQPTGPQRESAIPGTWNEQAN